MPRLFITLVLNVLAITCAVATTHAATGDRCSIGPRETIGILMSDGQCRGVAAGFAERYLHGGASQCTPTPQNGIEIAGTCIPDYPPSSTAAATPKEPNLSLAIQILNTSLLQLSAEVQAQSAEIEWLRSQINELRADLNR